LPSHKPQPATTMSPKSSQVVTRRRKRQAAASDRGTATNTSPGYLVATEAPARNPDMPTSERPVRSSPVASPCDDAAGDFGDRARSPASSGDRPYSPHARHSA